ncbi:DUF1572 domain-containing protein [Subsaximicrobium wynnwilliamsii]|uniref:DUF1572 domain-containing protein n=1 Tax=Subsaximicrobium wynnwilliamsii TaxID=291179 RepID=A0A5C6ZI37_9FLAO|nr:DUF1572 family protein [Subsaximicrobium wynnwilliamsii]TXD83097.1 DUF1572 domain-containing protein [Subsaximicrobium wynnwilliamsii]TXD88841.1 DUF1572 domain-containing protein [Subsaximicrobium wynnwilliamsii]TXE02914.1 DUF1572 domain-containing protein [Subsaximicrobium wynnwilliamsii]
MSNSYLNSVTKQFEYYKMLGDKTLEVLTIDELKLEMVADCNSAAIIVKHLCGNMLSRWTHFLTEDGEKSWRERDAEFIASAETKVQIINQWNRGWTCLFGALHTLQPKDLEQLIYIRNEGHTVTEAINSQLAHYAYHVGQMVFLGKLIKAEAWQSLSIPKGKSATYNQNKFSQDKARKHFTDDV